MSDWRVELGDCLAVLPGLAEGSADAIITDPPYGLEFMGAEWDSFRSTGEAWSTTKAMTDGPDWKGNARKRQSSAYSRSFMKRCRACGKQEFSGHPCKCPVPDWEIIASAPRQLQAFQRWCEQWAAAALRVLKPGGYLLAFGGTRTFHRLACALEDAGWEIRDTLCWLYGSGFPKGPGCLKPAWEPVLLCRRPGPRVLPLGVDECRVATRPERPGSTPPSSVGGRRGSLAGPLERVPYDDTLGRWPANVAHDGSPEVLGAFAAFGEKAGFSGGGRREGLATERHAMSGPLGNGGEVNYFGDAGSAARFFYCAKASKEERGSGNTHPTVKPLSLVRWLCRLVSAPGDLVLDPFAGSGTTGVACSLEGRRFLGVEREPAYHATALHRLQAEDARYPLFAVRGAD